MANFMSDQSQAIAGKMSRLLGISLRGNRSRFSSALDYTAIYLALLNWRITINNTLFISTERPTEVNGS